MFEESGGVISGVVKPVSLTRPLSQMSDEKLTQLAIDAFIQCDQFTVSDGGYSVEDEEYEDEEGENEEYAEDENIDAENEGEEDSDIIDLTGHERQCRKYGGLFDIVDGTPNSNLMPVISITNNGESSIYKNGMLAVPELYWFFILQACDRGTIDHWVVDYRNQSGEGYEIVGVFTKIFARKMLSLQPSIASL